MMNRREALRLLASGAALQLAPSKMLTLMREARAVLQEQASPAPKTLNPHQYATVKTVAELIFPRTETPGATDVGVVDFIDLILTEWFEDSQRTRFLAGIADIDARAQRFFTKDFIDSTVAQQGLVLTALGEQMIEDLERDRERDWSKAERSEDEVGKTVPEEHENEENQNFYSSMRQLVLTAYYTSEAGATQELHYEIIPARHAGCVEITLNEVGVNKVGSNKIATNGITTNHITMNHIHDEPGGTARP
jgi:gluconate 2-dehydrogenase gamma chain